MDRLNQIQSDVKSGSYRTDEPAKVEAAVEGLLRDIKKPRRLTKKQQEAHDDERIGRAYRARCCNIPISVMDIPKVFKIGHEAIAEGADDQALADRIAAYVETIR